MAIVHISIDIIKVISEKERMKKHLLLKTIAALMSCPKYKLSMKNKNMKKIYIHKIHLILCFTSVLCFGLPINAQQNAKNGAADNNTVCQYYGQGYEHSNFHWQLHSYTKHGHLRQEHVTTHENVTS